MTEPIPAEGNTNQEIPSVDHTVVDQLEVGNTTTRTAPVMDPAPSTMGKDCTQAMSNRLEVGNATASTTDPIPCATSSGSVGNHPIDVPVVSQRQIQVENDIWNELISINAIISTQFPSGVDDLGALIKKSIPTLDWHLDRLTHMLAYWKKKLYWF